MRRQPKDPWVVEAELMEFDSEDVETAYCAELADELDLLRIQAAVDPNFWDTMAEWDWYILDNGLWLALEQCCHEGVLLPTGQRELRVRSCPEAVLAKLSYFFRKCPVHVVHRLALTYWALVRIDRVKRTGSPVLHLPLLQNRRETYSYS